MTVDLNKEDGIVDSAEEDDDNKIEPVKGGESLYNCNSVVMWYQTTLDLTEGVAVALYNQERLQTPDHWAELKDPSIDMMVKQLRSDGKRSLAIPICSVQKLKLLAFACRYAERTYTRSTRTCSNP